MIKSNNASYFGNQVSKQHTSSYAIVVPVMFRLLFFRFFRCTAKRIRLPFSTSDVMLLKSLKNKRRNIACFGKTVNIHHVIKKYCGSF